MTSHRRPVYGSEASNLRVVIEPPRLACFCCNDTGIVANSDNLVNEYLSDYDVDFNGVRFSGGSCPIICRCSAAMNQQDGTGQVSRHGFRDDMGSVRTVDSEPGLRYFGCDLPKTAYREIHERRRQAWLATCQEIQRCRAARASGEDPDAQPWFMVEVAGLLRSLRDGEATSDRQGLTPVGASLGVAPEKPVDGQAPAGTGSRERARQVLDAYDRREAAGQVDPTAEQALAGAQAGAVSAAID